ncbi:MAG: hypothetical protein JXB24_00880 [Bacteroidales bacterium]|nr:hypothetical protein [Bacteroidales bacterium]
MKSKLFFLPAALLLLLSACRESALSDVEIDDPSILKVFGTVGKYTNLDSTVVENHIISLRIKDKTDHSVELKKGRVLCNDIEMNCYSDLLGPYYFMPEEYLDVTDNTLYTFVVELADGEQYPGSVFVDDDYLQLLEAPDVWVYTTEDSLTISWNQPVTDYVTQLYWHITFMEGANTEGKTASGWIDVTASNTYKFPPSLFANDLGENIAQELRIELESEKEGESNPDFYKGWVKARFTYVKEIAIE